MRTMGLPECACVSACVCNEVTISMCAPAHEVLLVDTTTGNLVTSDQRHEADYTTAASVNRYVDLRTLGCARRVSKSWLGVLNAIMAADFERAREEFYHYGPRVHAYRGDVHPWQARIPRPRFGSDDGFAGFGTP